MLNKLSYKKKNRLLLIAAVLFLWIIYSYSIKNTVAAYANCKQLENQIEVANNAPVQIAVLKSKLNRMDAVLGKQQSTDDNSQQVLLDKIAGYCKANDLSLIEVPQTIITNEKDLQIETNTFVVEGSFNKLLNLVYMLEQKNKTGRVASVKFQSRKDPRTKELNLTVAIYTQNIIKQVAEA